MSLPSLALAIDLLDNLLVSGADFLATVVDIRKSEEHSAKVYDLIHSLRRSLLNKS